MIFGVGVDTVQVERFTKYQPGDPFIQKYFTSAECTYLGTQGEGFAQSAAGLFAAKEAFVKGLGVGFRELSPKDVGVSHTELGRPYITLSSKGEALVAELGAGESFLSIAHDGGVATAFVVVEQGKRL